MKTNTDTKKVIKLTETDIQNVVKKLINEQTATAPVETPKPSKSQVEQYFHTYKNFKSIDHKLADIINWLHTNFGLGVDNDDPLLKSFADNGIKLMALLRKGKELSSKVVKNHYNDINSMISPETKAANTKVEPVPGAPVTTADLPKPSMNESK